MLKASGICVGNSMICSDIWHKYHKWYFQIVKRNLRQFWNIMSGIYAKYQVQIMLLFVVGLPGKPSHKMGFGRRCQKVVIRGRENTRVWYVETMFSQMVS